MSSSTIKLAFLDTDGLTLHKKRFSVTDDSLTVAAAIQSGLDRLGIASLKCQLKIVGKKNGSNKSFSVRVDDFIELDHEYTFTDPQLEASSEESAVAALSTPSTTPRTTFVRYPAFSAVIGTPTTPVSSRSTFVRTADTQVTPTATFLSNGRETQPYASPSTPLRPGTFGTTVAASVDFYDESSSNTVSLSAAPSSSNASTPLSSKVVQKYILLPKTKRINNYYIKNMNDIDVFYVSKNDAPGRMFHEVDVIQRFGLFQHWKTAFYLLCQQNNHELHEAAVYVITDACFDILRSVWPKLNVIPAEKQMLAQVVSFLTGCADLKNMTLPNRNGALDHKLKHFRRQHLDGAAEHQSPAAKRPKLSATAVGEEIDSISIELNPESDSSALHKLYKSTSMKRCTWIKLLHVDPNMTLGIITKIVSKFRHVTKDISLISYDFETLMASRRRPVKSLSEAFRRLIPAIYHYAREIGIPEAEILYDSTDEREYRAGPLLAAILQIKCPKSAVEYSRLVIDHSGSLDYRSAMDKRKAGNITAPSILIIGSAPAASFFIAADDMVFQVPGRFPEALQSYMELIFVSNVKYDKQTNGICYFLEYLMNIKDHQNTSRMAVCTKLEGIAAAISQRAPPIINQSINGTDDSIPRDL